MDDHQILAEAQRLLQALSRSDDEALRPLPAPGHIVSLEVWRDQTREESDPLLRERVLWHEDGGTLLDETAYAGYVAPDAGPRPGVFLHTFQVSPGWGEVTSFEQDADGAWWAASSDPEAEPEHAWTVRHAFGGLYRGRHMASGVMHWVHLQGDDVVVDDSDLWFM